jgi:hypothetical protein
VLATGERAVALAACLAACLVTASPASASQTIESFTVTPSQTQAGGHPNIEMLLDLGAEPVESVKSVVLDGPAGLNLLPRSSPTCIAADFAAEECPSASQVGLATLHGDHEGDPGHLLGTAALYLLNPGAGEFGRLGFVIPTVDSPLAGTIGLRSASDYGLRISLEGFPEAEPLQALDLSLWGVPAAPEHNPGRLPPGTTGCPGLADASCEAPMASSVAQTPFTENPTYCPTEPLSFGIDERTFEDFAHATSQSAPYPASSGCKQNSFDPSAEVEVGSNEVLNPTALDMDLRVPQTMSPNVPAPSQLEELAMFFVGGLTVEEAPLEGKLECGPGEAGIGSESVPACPPGSLLASAEVGAPLFPAPVAGGVYFGGPDPEGGYRLYLTASGYGVDLKLPLVLAVEAEDEEVAFLEFDLLPQIPIERIVMQFPGGASSPLVTAALCGEYPVETYFGPWDQSLAGRLTLNHHTLDAGIGGGPCPMPGSGGGGGGGSPPIGRGLPTPPTPVARIVKHPPRRSKRRRAKFAFRSSVAGSSFRCKVDSRRYRPCTSPVSYKLKPGHHVFRVIAVGPTGVAGRPATSRFTIRKPGKHRRHHKRRHQG